jgi:hypothetical protein
VLSLPLTYAPVSFTDKAIEMVKKRGCRTYVHHPILDARHWGIIDGKDISDLAFGKPGAKSPHDRFYYYRDFNLCGVRQGVWKLVLPGKPPPDAVARLKQNAKPELANRQRFI